MFRSAASSFIRPMIASFNSTCSPHDQSTLFILILYEIIYSSTLPQYLEIEILVIIFYNRHVIFLQLCNNAKNIEFLLLINPQTERIRQESSTVKFLTYQKTDDFYFYPCYIGTNKRKHLFGRRSGLQKGEGLCIDSGSG